MCRRFTDFTFYIFRKMIRWQNFRGSRVKIVNTKDQILKRRGNIRFTILFSGIFFLPYTPAEEEENNQFLTRKRIFSKVRRIATKKKRENKYTINNKL